MTKEEWIAEAKERISSNETFIADVCDMVGSDWSRHRSSMESAKRENKFLESGIKLLETNDVP